MRLVFCAVVLAVAALRVAADGGDDTLLALPPNGTTGRSLLQIKKNCPVNLETANYTEVTSRCKGPVYKESLCCAAFRDFACPYGVYINDMTTNCATIMLSYLRLYGSYPPGLFANTCKQDLKNGIWCVEQEISDTAGDSAAQVPAHANTAFTFCVYALIVILFC
nr:GPI-anchored protein LLG1-like [Lolium perenne]